MYATQKRALTEARQYERAPASVGSAASTFQQMAGQTGNQAMLAHLGQHSEPASTGESLPNAIMQRFERKSGVPLDDVRVHYNSDKPESFDAEAYAQGNEIFIGPGNEQNLEHEVGHVVQQKQGLVKPTGTEKGISINDDAILESSAISPVKIIPKMVSKSSKKGKTIQMRKKRKRTKDTPDGGSAPQVKKRKTMLTPRRTPATKKGTHGDKRNEQKRLTALFESAVSGITHESEHTIGFAAINHSGNPRRRMRRFENALPAYQEERIKHRVHIGTGYKTKENAHFDELGNWIGGIRFGFPGDKEYRDHQYSAIDTEYDSNNSMKGGKAQGDLISHVGNAIQLNQLGYSVAYQHQSSDEIHRKQSNNSFYRMAMSLRDTEVPYYDKDTHSEKKRKVETPEIAEMILARLVMQTGFYPGAEVENKVRECVGIPEISGNPSKQKFANIKDREKWEEAQKKMMDILEVMKHGNLDGD